MYLTSDNRYLSGDGQLTIINADLDTWEFVQYLSSGISSALEDVATVSGQVCHDIKYQLSLMSLI